MKKIFSKAMSLGLAVALTAAMVVASMTLANGDGLFPSDGPVTTNRSESDSPQSYDHPRVTEDHPVNPSGGESDEPGEYDHGPILDDEPANPAGDGVE